MEILKAIPGTRALNQKRISVRQWMRYRKAEFRIANELRSANSAGALLNALSEDEYKYWSNRIVKVVSDQNNVYIPRHRDAGKIKGRYLVMHNGLRVHPLCYYSRPILKMLIDNRGVHEPEEERAFAIVLKIMGDSPTIVELGCYWSFYSMWFLKKTRNGRAILVEANESNLESGKRNFQINSCKGDFLLALVGRIVSKDSVSVGSLMSKFDLDHIDLLHSDIQGAELEMLEGCEHELSEQRVNCVFVSTHSNEVHAACKRKLIAAGYIVLRDTNLDQTLSEDGLILAVSKMFYQQHQAAMCELQF